MVWVASTRVRRARGAATGMATEAAVECRAKEVEAMFADSPCRPTIAVRDKAKAIGFYRDVLGFKLVDANQPGATFACGGGTFLEIYPSEFAGTAKNTVAGFEVPDLEKAISELRSRGVSFEEYESPKTIDGIAHLGPNRGAWFKDPDGNIFALVERGSP
jgi:catechol 2,3-dioxygenase-like lactoylglutathione lyase family enzyme